MTRVLCCVQGGRLSSVSVPSYRIHLPWYLPCYENRVNTPPPECLLHKRWSVTILSSECYCTKDTVLLHYRRSVTVLLLYHERSASWILIKNIMNFPFVTIIDLFESGKRWFNQSCPIRSIQIDEGQNGKFTRE